MENNFPDALYLEQAQLYRDCFSVGKGFISADVFITVANESNFFTKILMKRYLIKMIFILNYKIDFIFLFKFNIFHKIDNNLIISNLNNQTI